MRDVRSRARLAALAVPWLVACPSQPLAPLEPCTVSGLNVDTAQDSVDRVDLLFMVDNSGSMAEEQLKLASKLSRLVLVLTSGDKEAGKPAPRDYPDRFFPPARSLHLGLVTSDLGRPPGTKAVPTCGDGGGLPRGGGVLQRSTEQAVNGISKDGTQLVPPDPSCAVNVPAYIDFAVTGAPYADPATAAAHFQCVAKVGIDGCGIEQQIAASLKALVPSSVTLFGGPDRGGQGDRANAGFLRTDSVLAVLMVTDEDDCSITDTPDGARMFTEQPLNTRCQLEYRDRPDSPALHAPKELAKSLVGLRGATPERFVLGGIVGLPLAGAGVAYDDLGALLAHPDMQVRADEKDEIVRACTEVVDPSVPRPSNVAAGDAKPGRRFVELAREVKALGGDAILRSICESDYGEALDQLIAKIAKQLRGPCLPRELPLDDQGLVACSVVEILPLGSPETCAAPGREPDGTRRLQNDPPGSDEHTACKLSQLAPAAVTPSTAGWFYDTSADTVAECNGLPRIQFTDALAVRAGALSRVECFRYAPRVAPGTRGFAALNTPCTPSAVGCLSKVDGADLALPGEPLVCEPLSQTCQIPCLADAQCPEGYRCSEAVVRTCQNPTCLAGGG